MVTETNAHKFNTVIINKYDFFSRVRTLLHFTILIHLCIGYPKKFTFYSLLEMKSGKSNLKAICRQW